MKPERRFKLGDTVTFKSFKEAGFYSHGGFDQGGVVGEVVDIHDELRSNSWQIRVRFCSREDNQLITYTMLECEFVEFDNVTSTPFKTKTKKKIEFNY
jgi:hypothetical protein